MCTSEEEDSFKLTVFSVYRFFWGGKSWNFSMETQWKPVWGCEREPVHMCRGVVCIQLLYLPKQSLSLLFRLKMSEWQESSWLVVWELVTVYPSSGKRGVCTPLLKCLRFQTVIRLTIQHWLLYFFDIFLACSFYFSLARKEVRRDLY